MPTIYQVSAAFSRGQVDAVLVVVILAFGFFIAAYIAKILSDNM
jgi:hypothetical protein